MNQHNLKFGNSEIIFQLSYKQRKTLGIKVLPDGSVEVVAPLEAEIVDIYEKLTNKARWVLKQQAYFRSFLPHTPTRKYISSETHLYLGRQYMLQVIPAKDDEVKLKRGILEVYINESNPEYVEKNITKFYRERARKMFELLWQKCKTLDKRFEQSTELKIKQMQKRWGSCSRTGTILLNLELIKTPKACIEYVIIHERCHLVYHNHSKDFYNFQTTLFPDWERWKEKLERLMV